MSRTAKESLFIVTSGFGDGHSRAAEVLALALRRADPELPIRIVDLYATLTPRLYPLVLRGYRLTLRRVPELLGATYAWSARIQRGAFPRIHMRLPKLDLPVHLHVPGLRERTPSLRFSTALAHAFATIFDGRTPGTVVATAPVPLLLMGEWRRRQGLSFPLVYLATDFIPHPVVAREEVDLYFVAHDEAKARLVAVGVASERIRVTGIPVHPAFVRASSVRSKRLARSRKAGPLCLLVAGGGWGLVAGAEALIRDLLASPRSFSAANPRSGGGTPFLRMLVLGGKNPEMAQKSVDHLSHPAIAWKVLPYLEPGQVAALLATADGLLTKPGGISLAEALTVGVPTFLLPPLPGPEKENARFLTEAGFVGSGGGEQLLDWLRGISDPNLQRETAARQHTVVSPHATERVACELLKFLEKKRKR